MTQPPTSTAAPEYTLGTGISRFTIRGFAGGLLSAVGHNPVIGVRSFEGEVRGDPAHPESLSLRMRIPAASLIVENDMRESDRREMQRVMQQDVLEVDQYPEITFASDRVATLAEGRYQIDGNLTLHGITRPQRVLAYVTVTGDMLRAYGEFTVRQTDFRIKLASVAGGVLKLKDELKCAFDMVARRKPEPGA